MRTLRFTLTSLAWLVLSGTLLAQTMTVPVNLQAAIFKKVLGFDRTLAGKKSVEVAIVFTDGKSKDDIIAAFTQFGITAKGVHTSSLPDGLGSASVVYVAPGVTPPRQLCIDRSLLSISGVSGLVERGQVSIGLAVEGGKPRILVHASQLRSEGHELATEVLNMAKIIP